ncbi:hypothetical protein PR202_ga24943 [Eleusine coracana subsp. coracana]|uniref:Uncharacterized protein n=1 Tax=Eleusine coracana subsp. coracana TaxID=191504 RepID=A0AAV5D9R7_ELECO|nr:hypothetical protein PR202_ga24943 [Eleusine coracana subsp. coracana]
MEPGFSSLPWPTLLPPVLICVALFSYLYTILWLKPERLRQKLRKQGVKGPNPSFLFGNIPEMRRIKQELAKSDQEMETGTTDLFSSNYLATIFPYFLHWSRVYDPDMAKELANCKSLDLGKPCYLQKELGALLGMGILTSNGDLWLHERKGMVNLMVEAGNTMLNLWESEVEKHDGGAEVVVDEYLRNLSADVISRASFGSSFAQGKEIFNKIRQLQMLMAKQDMLIGVPGFRYLPTKSNREIWSLDTSIRNLILNIAKNHEEHDSATHINNDLLHSIIEGAKGGPLSSCTPEDFIVDNCKNIYFAGHETTSTTATWCLLLLASHPKWQSSARGEVLEVCLGNSLQADMLQKLKTLTMVIQETLRLYPPAAFVTREALNDIKLGGINIPKGTNIRIPIAMVHRDPSVWGPNSDRFDPGRFANGIAGACKPSHMYMPFGVGARTCAGQNLAMVELKVVLSLLLSKFEFTLSPNYMHCPAFRLTIEPGQGVPLILKRL